MTRKFPLFFIFILIIFTSSCKTPAPPDSPPPQPKAPEAVLVFTGIQADDPSPVSLDFLLTAVNSRPETADMSIVNWNAEINGENINDGIVFKPELSGINALSGQRMIPLTLELDMEFISGRGIPLSQDMEIDIIIDTLFVYENEDSPVRAWGKAVFTPVQNPVFSIIDIAVLKDELINTKFMVRIKVENPNPFPVSLSSFNYELYGDGRFWADGSEKNSLDVPGLETKQTDLYLGMNFIDMSRNLLNQIINLQNVEYRFCGEAQVSLNVDYLPHFTDSFELSGYSRVYDY